MPQSSRIDYFELPSSGDGSDPDLPEGGVRLRLQGLWAEYAEITGAGVLGGLTDGEDRSAGPLIGIRADDIAAAQRAIEAAGGVITRPVYGYPGGQRFYFREPGGNEMMVYSPGE